MTLTLREMTPDEQAASKRLARSRTASAREVGRARIVEVAGSGERVPAVAARLEVAAKTVRTWLKRFDAGGVGGLRDRPRSGRPTTFTAVQHGSDHSRQETWKERTDIPV